LFYGYIADNVATPPDENLYLRSLLNISKTAGNIILVTDYCSTLSNMDDSFAKNSTCGYISFSADRRELDNIPAYPNPIYAENTSEVSSLEQVQNFLYLINPTNFSSKQEFINAIKSTNYDLLIMDLFFTDGAAFTSSEINQLRSKANGGSRLIIAYLSIGEAEDYRYYWQPAWHPGSPFWLDNQNPDWEGNYKVKYWLKEWQDIIYGNSNSYLKKILDAGFDGAYLDIIDAFEYFE
jgi:cysteinyl-tRNA synthetase